MNPVILPLNKPEAAMKTRISLAVLAGIVVLGFIQPMAEGQLAGTARLAADGDLAMEMVEGIGAYLERETAACREKRAEKWQRDFSSHEAYVKSVEPNRERFKTITGVVDERVPAEMPYVSTVDTPALMAETNLYKVYAVRWPVLPGVNGEGLLVEPAGEARANVVALPDCDTAPEALVGLAPGVEPDSQFARILAENGCRVVVPVIVDRDDEYSASAVARRATNQPHREFVYRHAYELGRHIIGYEVQKVLAAVDWFKAGGGAKKPSGATCGAGVPPASYSRVGYSAGETPAPQQREPSIDNLRSATPPDDSSCSELPVGVIGYGEGGLVAFYAAAVDERIDAAAVSGYFGPREDLWREPIYRDVWALLTEFGDAEVASLIAPRALIVEAAPHPEVAGPPPEKPGRRGAASGAIVTPKFEAVAAEFDRAQKIIAQLKKPAPLRLLQSAAPGDPRAISEFLGALRCENARARLDGDGSGNLSQSSQLSQLSHCPARMQRQITELIEHTQRVMREAPRRREAFWRKANPATLETWQVTTASYRDYFHEEVIGKLPPPSLPANPRTRLVYDEPEFKGYEVMLDVYPDVFAYGILLVPTGLGVGEKRPAVVCQHGLEGRPREVADPNADMRAYNRFGSELAKRGYIVYAPQNPYIGGKRFRQLQRKAHPLKLSLFSFIVRQHEQTLDWLASLPFVQPDKIAFYGLSYGGKTAMRVPAILPRYCLSICSGDFNEWIWKIADTDAPFSYVYTNEYDMLEWNLANTFNYAEMSWLIMPGPFMVERGHDDGVGIDEWVAYEYARTRRKYDRLNIGDRTEIEFFDGPHEINGAGTFRFLDKWLK